MITQLLSATFAVMAMQTSPVARAENARGESILLGEFIHDFEVNAIVPFRKSESADESTWVRFSESARGTKRLYEQGDKPLIVCVKGVRIGPGQFGHLGGYPYKITVSEILGIGRAAEPACALRGVKRPVSPPVPVLAGMPEVPAVPLRDTNWELRLLLQRGKNSENSGNVRGAINIYTKTLKYHSEEGARLMGDIYRYGRGDVPRDDARSMWWYKVAKRFRCEANSGKSGKNPTECR